MATERPKDREPGKEPSDDDPEERPTVIPKFDPAELARRTAESSREGSVPASAGPGTLPRRTTPLGIPEIPEEAYRTEGRPREATLTSEVETEGLRRASRDSKAPETTQMPESMRSSLLSMANSRVSAKPLANAGEPFSKTEKGWEELTFDEPISGNPPTKPSQTSTSNAPGSGGLFGRQTSRSRAPSGGQAPFAGEDPANGDEAPTREHPVLADEAPPESRGVPREEPSVPFVSEAHDSGEHTVFAPARAAAALTTPSTRPPSMSERPAPKTAPSGVPPSPEDTIREMRDRFSLGDYTGALVLAEGILEDTPNNVEVKECAEQCRQVLRQMYTARLGPLDRVPVVTVARDQLRWLSIDHRAGFVLSHIDGVSSLEMILDVSGMPLLDALRILCELAQQRIISFR